MVWTQRNERKMLFLLIKLRKIITVYLVSNSDLEASLEVWYDDENENNGWEPSFIYTGLLYWIEIYKAVSENVIESSNTLKDIWI